VTGDCIVIPPLEYNTHSIIGLQKQYTAKVHVANPRQLLAAEKTSSGFSLSLTRHLLVGLLAIAVVYHP